MHIPVLDADLWSAPDEGRYRLYQTIRDMGPVVREASSGMYLLGRFHDVSQALRASEVFRTESGVALNEAANETLLGSTLCLGGERHRQQRRVLVQPLNHAAVDALEQWVQAEVDQRMAQLVAAGQFDAVADLAQWLPVTILRNLLALPEHGCRHAAGWSEAFFDFAGIPGPRSGAAAATIQALIDYVLSEAVQQASGPATWAQGLTRAVAAGELTPQQMPRLLLDYIVPSIDTTSAAIASALWLFGSHPEQWDLLREHPELIDGAIDEVIRYETPIQMFSRQLGDDLEMDGYRLPQGARVVLLYGSANRDERKWTAAEQFDIRRRNADHLGFGHGRHFCAGVHLARLELRAVLLALVRQVERFDTGPACWKSGTIIRGLAALPVRVPV